MFFINLPEFNTHIELEEKSRAPQKKCCAGHGGQTADGVELSA